MEFVKLTEQQRKQFDDYGYLVVRKAIDADTIARLIAAGDRLIESGLTEDRQTTEDGLFDGIRNIVAHDDAFIPLITCPATLPLIVQLFGPHIHLVTSHLIYKHPDAPETRATARVPSGHRDVAGTTEDLGHAHVSRVEMKAAFYLTDLSKANSGATLMAPGSNHLKKPMEIDPETGDPENMVEPSLEAGDVVLFENRTYHAGAPNLSTRTRKAVMFGYGYMWMAPFDYKVMAPRVTEQLDPIGHQLVGALTDPEGRFIPGGIDTPLRDWCRAHNVAPRQIE